MKFTGHERDLGNLGSAADDIDYMHARFYQPQLGRMLSFDPIGGNDQAPQTWNRYAYVLGNPLKYTDPEGLEAACAQEPGRIECTDDQPITVKPSASEFQIQWGIFKAEFEAARNSPLVSTQLTYSERLLSAIPDRPAQAVGEAIVGFGDTVSFGLTALYRREVGLDDMIDDQSGAYLTGEVLGIAHGVALGGAVAAKATASTRLFGPGTRFNTGRWLRVGHSAHEGKTYFSLRGQLIDKIFRGSQVHKDLWRISRPR